MNAHVTGASLLWTTLLRALGICACSRLRLSTQDSSTEAISARLSLPQRTRWVDRVRLSAPR